MANKTNGNQVLVERETYEKDGNTYFSHVVKGKIRARTPRRRRLRNSGYRVRRKAYGGTRIEAL